MRIIAIICDLLRLYTFPFAMSRPSASKKGWLAYYSGLIGTWAKKSSLPHDAEDAAQDSIEGLLRGEHAAAIDQKAYLYRAAQNHLISEIRRQSRHEALPLHELSDDEHPLQHDPDVVLRTAELMQALHAALLELPLKCQQVFLWNKIEGYTQEEIAHKLQLTPSSVEKYMKRAMRHLQERLQNHAPH